jgi:hypothetical protein
VDYSAALDYPGNGNAANSMDSLSSESFRMESSLGDSTKGGNEGSLQRNDSLDGDRSLANTGRLDSFTVNQPSQSRQRLHFMKYDKHRASARVGLAEEAKLETFLSDDGLEQLAVYCR